MATVEELESRCTIDIVGVALGEKEREMMDAVLGRCVNHLHYADNITIYCAEARSDGWLEWTIRVTYQNGTGLTIGCVRRSVGAEVEFHT